MSGSASKLRGLRENFARRLSTRYEELETALTKFFDEGDERSLSDLQRLAHNLRGSAGSYGYAEIGRLVGRLDELSAAWRPGVTPDPRFPLRLMGLLRREIHDSQHWTRVAASDLPMAPGAAAGCREVHFLEDDDETANLVAEQLRPYGYRVTTHRESASLIEAMREEVPAALIFDVRLTGGEWGPATALELPPEVRGKIPILFLSAHGDLDSRVQAVRAGAAAYLTKPPDIDEIVELLDRLTRPAEPEPYRVLVVDDSASTGQFYAAALQESGMVTCLATNAPEAMSAIEDFGPEIILLDLYMPDVGGAELAQVIRQYPSLLSIPIVFVSAETDEKLQLAALGHGADDFLTKPVDVGHLTSSVRIRAQRYRQLRASMQRDSLTGLLNHRNAKESLEAELARAERTGSPLSVAMLDIDDFKQVNDTYGHPTGDLVIRSLARILTQRLRRSDVIGRYGGEEFLVLMPDTPAGRAAEVLDQLCRSFAVLNHQSGEDAFRCSMSCGLTQAGREETTDDVLGRADSALYGAKQAGKNRVVTR